MWKAPKNWEFILALFIVVYFVFVQYLAPESKELIHLGKYLRELSIDYINYNTNDEVNFPKFAYVQYATNLVFLNLAIVNFIQLKKSSRVSNFVVLYNKDLKTESKFDHLFSLALSHGIKLDPVSVITTEQGRKSEWGLSYTKFHVFNQLAYERVVYFDADSMLVNAAVGEGEDGEVSFTNNAQNLDELFSIPMEFNLALPQAYWLYDPSDKTNAAPKSLQLNTLATHVMVINPNREIFREIGEYVYNPFSWSFFHRSRLIQTDEFDMDILNRYIGDKLAEQVKLSQKDKAQTNPIKVGILPHTVYGVLTGEFKHRNHAKYSAKPQDLQFIRALDVSLSWDALKTLKTAKLIHFSDAPIPKPWDGELDNQAYYNHERIYCGDARSFNETEYLRKFPSPYKPRIIEDCNSVKVWDWIRDEFENYRRGNWIV